MRSLNYTPFLRAIRVIFTVDIGFNRRQRYRNTHIRVASTGITPTTVLQKRRDSRKKAYIYVERDKKDRIFQFLAQQARPVKLQ